MLFFPPRFARALGSRDEASEFWRKNAFLGVVASFSEPLSRRLVARMTLSIGARDEWGPFDRGYAAPSDEVTEEDEELSSWIESTSTQTT